MCVEKILAKQVRQRFLYKIKEYNEIKIIEGHALKKSLIIFVVAISLPLVLVLLSFLEFTIITYFTSPASISAFPSLMDTESKAFSLLNLLVGTFGAFALFYFLGIKTKTKVVKSVTLALFIGLLVGLLVGEVITVASIYIFYGVFSWVPSIELYIVDISGLLSGVFGLFFPALVALLFVDLRERKSHNN